MKSRIFDLIKVDEYSATPKYLQLANSILSAIEVGKIKKDDILPSINELTAEYNISNVTAQKGYNYLRKTGVLESIPGKGFFIKSSDIQKRKKIFLLFNKLSAHKKIMYDSFVKTLGDQATIDFYVYNNNFRLFKNLILSKTEDYSYYVIIPHFLEQDTYAHAVINAIPKEKLILLDKELPGVTGQFSAVYENFEKDIYGALEQALVPLRKYDTLKIIFPEHTYHPKEIIKGFYRFCEQYRFMAKVVHNIVDEPIHEGEVYINLMEDDLVVLLEKILALNLTLGIQVGIISYNETPLKKFILNGLTTISTDFERMGSMAADLILSPSPQRLEVPFRLTLRNSL